MSRVRGDGAYSPATAVASFHCTVGERGLDNVNKITIKINNISKNAIRILNISKIIYTSKIGGIKVNYYFIEKKNREHVLYTILYNLVLLINLFNQNFPGRERELREFI